MAAGVALLIALAYSTLSSIGWIDFELELVLAVVVLVLWLTFEGVTELAVASVAMRKANPERLSWTEALPDIIDHIKHATSSIYVLGSSSESMFLNLRESLQAQTDVAIQVLLRKVEVRDTARLVKLAQYQQYWRDLADTDSRRSVEVKFAHNQFLRGIIIDQRIGYLGFYVWKDGRLWGHNLPVIHYEAGSELGDYYLGVYLNRFRQLWNAGSEEPVDEDT